jgi:hypothetical protein
MLASAANIADTIAATAAAIPTTFSTSFFSSSFLISADFCCGDAVAGGMERASDVVSKAGALLIVGDVTFVDTAAPVLGVVSGTGVDITCPEARRRNNEQSCDVVMRRDFGKSCMLGIG